MFKKLTDFGYHRTAKEAFGFYLAYFLFVMLAGGLVGGVFGSLIPDSAYENGFRVGTTLSVLSALGLSYLVMLQKKQMNNFRFIILGLLSGILGLFGGGLLGLIIPAYLTTQNGGKRVSSARHAKSVSKASVSKTKVSRSRK